MGISPFTIFFCAHFWPGVYLNFQYMRIILIYFHVSLMMGTLSSVLALSFSTTIPISSAGSSKWWLQSEWFATGHICSRYDHRKCATLNHHHRGGRFRLHRWMDARFVQKLSRLVIFLKRRVEWNEFSRLSTGLCVCVCIPQIILNMLVCFMVFWVRKSRRRIDKKQKANRCLSGLGACINACLWAAIRRLLHVCGKHVICPLYAYMGPHAILSFGGRHTQNRGRIQGRFYHMLIFYCCCYLP